MSLLKERLLREMETLSPEDLLAVQQLIERLKQSPPPAPSPASSAQRVRAALSHLSGSLSKTIAQEREERI